MNLTAADIANDLQTVADNVELVSVTAVDPDTGALGTVTANVPLLSRVVEIQEQQAGGVKLKATKTRFHLQANKLPEVPRERYLVTQADGTKWIIGKVTSMTFGTRYVCEVTKKPT